MNTKLLAMLLTAAMLVSPVIGFWHPPPPVIPQPTCKPVWETLINGNLTYHFAEPMDGFCENFNVTVYILNVTDLYGYQFDLLWDPIFNLVSYTVATNIWTAQAIIFNGTLSATSYRQVVTALPPSLGANGTFALAELVFHINNDVCYPDTVADNFPLTNNKLSDSCSGIITPCTSLWANFTFTSVQPVVYITPVAEVNSIVGSKYTATVWIANITKMTDFHIDVRWYGWYHFLGCIGNVYTVLLTTDNSSVVVNNALFPVANSTININVVSPACGHYANWWTAYGDVHVDATLDPDMAQINATHPGTSLWLFNITFTKCDAWFCGAQPLYQAKPNHDWRLENASTNIIIMPYDGTSGYISTCCGTKTIAPGTGGNDYVKAIGANFTFVPIPGDLDGSGHVDIADLMIESAYYGLDASPAHQCDPTIIPVGPPSTIPAGPTIAYTYFYDLNKDGVIDIYDIVIVAKNFCRSVPSDP